MPAMAQRRWLLGLPITAGYTLAAVAVLASGVAAYVQTKAMRDATDRARQSQVVLHEIERVEIELLKAETGQRGYLLTGQPSYLEPYDAARQEVGAAIEDLKLPSWADLEDQARLATLTELAGQKLTELKTTIDAQRAGQSDAALAVVQTNVGKGLMDQIRTVLGEMRVDVQDRLEHEVEKGNLRFWWAGRIGLLSSALALVVVILSTIAANATVWHRDQAERARQASEERLRVTMRSIGDAVIATDLAGRITFINHVAVDLTGWPIPDARGRPLNEVFRIVNEHTRQTVESPVDHVLREGKIVGLANHTVLLARDGTEIPIDDSGAPIRDADGNVMGVVLVFRDVRKRRQQAAESEQLRLEAAARAEAERTSAMKDDFLAILSHELRSPLQGILGWLTVLRETGSDPHQHRALQAIDRGVRQQAQLVNDILDISRIVAGKLQIERAPVDVGSVVEDCVDDAMPAARQRQLQLTSTIGSYGAVVGDRRRLRQAVSNLLNNAIKFTPRGGRIDVHCHRQDAVITITVSDTGEGISPDLLPYIFDRFRQGGGDMRARHSASGLGLGLSLARQIVELHGGSIRAESAGAGCGSTFTLQLPVRSDGHPTAELAGAPVDMPATTLSGLHLLIVDDDADTRESLAMLLRLRGADVELAESAGRALESSAAQRPDVIVTDISMPDRDGYDLLAALRDRSPGRLPKVVALTGFASPADRERATAAGFDAHVAKPIDVGELITTILELARPG